MPIKLECPECSASLRVLESSIGRKAKCPKCGRQIEIPKPSLSINLQKAPSEPLSSKPLKFGKRTKLIVSIVAGVVACAIGACFVILSSGTGMSSTSPNLRPTRYYSAKTIPGGLGTSGGDLEPQKENHLFFVVVTEVPIRWLYVSEDGDDIDKLYNPDSFHLLLPGGHKLAGVLIKESRSQGFAPGIKATFPAGKNARKGIAELESVSVAWQIEDDQIVHPLKLQFKEQRPVPIPQNAGPVPGQK